MFFVKYSINLYIILEFKYLLDYCCIMYLYYYVNIDFCFNLFFFRTYGVIGDRILSM